MARIRYESKNFQPKSLAIIRQADAICAEYAADGYDLTLRQLYYQFVARDIIPNKQTEYKRLGSLVNKARLAGLLDWDYIVDRTRNLQSLPHWRNPADIIQQVSRQFRLDKWASQPVHVEVWIEKEALAGVVERVCDRLDVPFFACRGYVSQSEQWRAGRRFTAAIEGGQRVVVLHLGDHDPSGIDMTRDNLDRLRTFVEQDYLNAHDDEFEGTSVSVRDIRAAMAEHCGAVGEAAFIVKRIALNMDQVEQYSPPPNPAKMTDSRFNGYADLHGDESWELDALPPNVLADLIEADVDALRDEAAWENIQADEDEHRNLLAACSARWSDVTEMLA